MPDAPTRSPAASGPSVVALDVNETLADMSALHHPLEAVGAPGEILQTWFTQTLRDGFALTVAGGYASFAAVAQATLRSLVGDLPALAGSSDEVAADVVSAIGELPLHDDVALGLQRLHDAGIRVVTLTNGSASTARRLLESADLAHLVEQFLSVESVKRWKPDPRPYLFAAETCGVSPQQMMLAAVHPWDVDGAKRAGLAAAWIDRSGAPYPEFFSTPDVTCSALPALADAIRRRCSG